MPPEDLAERLDNALLNAVASDCMGDFGILFSGGLDSSLVAKYARDLGKDPVLISVGMEGSSEWSHVREAASFFDLRFIPVELSPDDLEGLAKEVMAITGDPRPMTVGIGIPIYAALKRARDEGIGTMLCGQGADELFGGYHRYKAMEGAELERALEEDAKGVFEKDLERDLAIARACSIELRAPFLSPEVVEAAARIPLSKKVTGGRGKVILRELGRRRGLPETIWDRKKKAVQYSSGVDRELRKIAKRKGMKLGDYLKGLIGRG